MPCRLFLCLLIAPVVGVASAATPADQQEPLDTVVVEGTRAQLSDMRQQMVVLEDRFYERYNELNPIDDFDTHCYRETRAGTLLTRRYCRAVFQAKALEAEGKEYLDFLKRSVAVPGEPQDSKSPPGPPSPAVMAYAARQTEYQRNLLEVSSRHPELVDLLRMRFELGQRYQDTRSKVFGLTPPQEEEESLADDPAKP